MKTRITVRHGRVCAETQDKIRDKVSKLALYNRRVSGVDVVVDLRDRHQPAVELRVDVKRATEVVMTLSAAELFAALDALLPKVIRRLSKLNQQQSGHRVASTKRIEFADEAA